MNRRRFLQSTTAIAALAPSLCHGQGDAKCCSLSIGTYSLKGIALEDAVPLVSGIGFDGIEIAAQPGFDGEPSRMPRDRRREIRRRLDDVGLALTSIMEQITPAPDPVQNRADLERLGRVLDLARDLNNGPPSLVQTVLGGGTWDEKKGPFRDRVGQWQEAAASREVILAIKPHRSGAMSRPSEAIWLIEQLGKPRWLKMVFDYSHYAFREMPLEETCRESFAYTADIVVKDAVKTGETVTFALPGEAGTIDYVTLLRRFYDAGYRGDVCCEVSSALSRRDGYDPKAAARTCYANMAAVFDKAGIRRC